MKSKNACMNERMDQNKWIRMNEWMNKIEITSEDFQTSWWSIWIRASEHSERVDFWYFTKESEKPEESAFHAVICLFYTYWDFFIYPALIHLVL